jgi:hypothetical protein
MCESRDGDVLGACESAAQVLTDGPGRYRAGLVRQRAIEIYRVVPHDLQHTSRAQRLADALADTIGAPPAA